MDEPTRNCGCCLRPHPVAELTPRGAGPSRHYLCRWCLPLLAQVDRALQ